MSNSSRPHGLQPTRLLYPWAFPGKSTGVGCHRLLRSLGLEWKLTFCSPMATAEFLKFAGILSAASSFRIWNSSAGILSPLLALFEVMVPKAHLTSQSRMSGSRWLTTPSWLSKSLISLLYSSSYSYHLFLISSASVRSLLFLSFIMSILTWSVPLVSPIFLKRSLVASMRCKG